MTTLPARGEPLIGTFAGFGADALCLAQVSGNAIEKLQRRSKYFEVMLECAGGTHQLVKSAAVRSGSA